MTEEKGEITKALGITAGAIVGYLLITVLQALFIALILKYLVGVTVGYYQVLGCVIIWDLIKPSIQIQK